MPAVYLVSDTHFGHAGIVRFTENDGVTKVRPWSDVVQMNRDMVEYWNQTVKPNDKVIHLGDVVINRRYLPILSELNGTKVLIKGNHDQFRMEEYTEHFTDIKSYHSMAGFILSHIPIHPNQFHRWKGNIHGHMHSGDVTRECMIETGIGMMPDTELDPRYMNVCVEKTNYRPILFEQVMARYKKRGIE